MKQRELLEFEKKTNRSTFLKKKGLNPDLLKTQT